MSDKSGLASPIQVGLYCWECQQVRRIDGSRWQDDPRSPGYVCGFDYGPDRHSHLRVSPVYVTHEPVLKEVATLRARLAAEQVPSCGVVPADQRTRLKSERYGQ